MHTIDAGCLWHIDAYSLAGLLGFMLGALEIVHMQTSIFKCCSLLNAYFLGAIGDTKQPVSVVPLTINQLGLCAAEGPLAQPCPLLRGAWECLGC